MSSSLIIIILIIAIFFLVYKYQKIGNTKVQVLTPRKVPKQQQSYMANRDVMPHMTYSTGPFDEYMWRYPEQGGRTIVSQQNSPYGQGLLPRPMPPGPTYIGQYPYYIKTFNGPF